jgi:hypothetical protein
MPSDDRVDLALSALARPIANYRAFVVTALGRQRALLDAGSGADRARLELGEFGGGRIDAARFAELGRGTALDAPSRDRIRRASTVLQEIADLGDRAFVADVRTGESLRLVVGSALARLGRAFAAAATSDLVRRGRYEPERHDQLLDSCGIEWWSLTVRQVAPPLVVTVDGADLRTGALAEFLDGAQRIVLVVRGPSAPAPLVRCITPGTFVAQVVAGSGDGWREVFGRLDGPGIIALVADTAARFVHDPGAGASVWQRLTITGVPTDPTRRSLGALSPAQQREELAQLSAMAARPALPEAPVDALVAATAGAGADPAERLTQWLLTESGLFRQA